MASSSGKRTSSSNRTRKSTTNSRSRQASIGKLKEKYLVNGINEYVKRLNAYCKVEMVEVPDQKEDGRYELVSGHRRKRACELAGFETLRSEIVDLNRDEAVSDTHLLK